MQQIFISHSSKNKEFIKSLKAEFPKVDYLTWVSFENIKPGTDFDETILENLKKSTIIIFVLTKEAIDSAYVNQEIGYVLALGDKEIIPIIENFSDLPGFLSKKNALTLYPHDPARTYAEIIPWLKNEDIYGEEPYKETISERFLTLMKPGYDLWLEIFKNMDIGLTPISSFMGSFESYLKKSEPIQIDLKNRIKIFDDFFIKSGLVEPGNLEEEKDRHYSYEDLKNWEKYLGMPVLYRLTAAGKGFYRRLEKKKVGWGSTLVYSIKKVTEPS